MKIWFYFWALILVFPTVSNAKLLIEPYLGYGKGEFTLESSLGNNESDVDGPGLGFRLGYARGGFFIAPDLMFQLVGDFEPSLSDANLPTDTSASRIADATHGIVFLTTGYKFPVLPLRVYAGYQLYGTYSLDFSNGADADLEGSGGYKLGLGYKPGFLVLRAPFMINLEYIVVKFDEATGIGTISGNATEFPFITGSGGNLVQYNDADIQTIFLSLSFPFQLFGN